MLVAQESENHDHEHHHGDELGIAAGVVPLLDEDKVTAGFHLHYIKSLSHIHWYGIGVSLETIFDEHKHYTISLANQFRIYRGLFFLYAPGILFLKEEADWEYKFAQHFEIGYEFPIGNFHIGPLLDFAVSSAGTHYMVGIHFAINL
jgi:hypothetical protein